LGWVDRFDRNLQVKALRCSDDGELYIIVGKKDKTRMYYNTAITKVLHINFPIFIVLLAPWHIRTVMWIWRDRMRRGIMHWWHVSCLRASAVATSAQSEMGIREVNLPLQGRHSKHRAV